MNENMKTTIAVSNAFKKVNEKVAELEAENARLRRELDAAVEHFNRRILEKTAGEECEFCGNPATKVEAFDRPVPVCNECGA